MRNKAIFMMDQIMHISKWVNKFNPELKNSDSCNLDIPKNIDKIDEFQEFVSGNLLRREEK